MDYIISYEKVSPALLATLIEKAVPNAIPMYTEINEDSFEMYINWWDENQVTYHELSEIDKIVASYL